ncbi:MAG: hypothetical protein CME10_04210, partial [Gemmatimonadetes bacterium]|nr:hypothetical protein [Gemmatimonadota bacterium]
MNRSYIFIIILICFLLNPIYSNPIQFVEVTESAGIHFKNSSGNAEKRFIIETQSAGVSFADLNGNGQLDLFFTNGIPSNFNDKFSGTALYKNAGNGTFVNRTDQSNARILGWTMGMAIADYDSDGDRDLYVTRWGKDVMLVGARIGWVRGTGLMAALDRVYEKVESDLGIRTFAPTEMADLILESLPSSP